MNLNQSKLDSLLSQLNMALAKHPPSAIQIAMLRAQIREFRGKVK